MRKLVHFKRRVQNWELAAFRPSLHASRFTPSMASATLAPQARRPRLQRHLRLRRVVHGIAELAFTGAPSMAPAIFAPQCATHRMREAQLQAGRLEDFITQTQNSAFNEFRGRVPSTQRKKGRFHRIKFCPARYQRNFKSWHPAFETVAFIEFQRSNRLTFLPLLTGTALNPFEPFLDSRKTV